MPVVTRSRAAADACKRDDDPGVERRELSVNKATFLSPIDTSAPVMEADYSHIRPGNLEVFPYRRDKRNGSVQWPFPPMCHFMILPTSSTDA